MAKFKEHTCSCDTCKSMCHHVPCTGTPAETEKLIEAGYADKLITAIYNDISFVRPRGDNFWTDCGRCPFLTKNDLCSLHKKGLKPLEGRIAIHGSGGSGYHKKAYVVKTWDTPEGKRILGLFEAIEAEMIKAAIKKQVTERRKQKAT